MVYRDGRAEQVKIAYIGGGSRGWGWGLMSDLASCGDMSGDVYLYDIDFSAAQHNEVIGNLYRNAEGARSVWNYHAVRSAGEALTGADFVVISILPGNFDDMESDVHAPEKYGIYQSVGDTTGPGGTVRAMRTLPMYEEIAANIRRYCPKAWVISYTNPMTLCVKTLYRVFPEIRAFGCCHEVFGTQKALAEALLKCRGAEAERHEIKVNPVGVNHFTWLTDARYRDLDLFPVWREFAERYAATGYTENLDKNWMNNSFSCSNRVKFDLFLRYGVIAAAGDRHLAEFCEGGWYLRNPETVRKWGFGLTTVKWRKEDLAKRLAKSEGYRNGSISIAIRNTGEEGVEQMRAILGLRELVTNVNLPNVGQIPNLPLGAVVETNAVFRSGSVTPVFAGDVPKAIYPLVARVSGQQEALSDAIARRNGKDVFNVFLNDPLTTCSYDDARLLFREMVANTASYLSSYDLTGI